MNTLAKLHNLMINCTNKREFQEHVVNLSVDNVYNDHYDALLDNALENPVLAAEFSKIPLYYFKASMFSGLRQDKDGNFLKVGE
jgi:hypothetical protein